MKHSGPLSDYPLCMEQERPHLRFVGEARRVPTGGAYQPDRLAYDIPGDLPPETPIEQTDGGRLAKRLIIAFVAIIALGVVNIALLRRYGLDLPPVVLLSAFGVIFAASVIPSIEGRSKSPREEDACADEGCAVGCCSGPRPVGELSRKARERMQPSNLRLPGHAPRS